MPADPTTVALGTDASVVIKDTVVAVWTAVGPMGVGIVLAVKALPWAAQILGLMRSDGHSVRGAMRASRDTSSTAARDRTELRRMGIK